MNNFVFNNPTKILFGRETLPSIGKETRLLGGKVLLVYGQNSLRNNGTLDTILDSFQKADLVTVEFGGIQPNPLLSKVREGIQLVKQEKIEVVVGAGGGSVIDTAKAIAAGAVVEHDVWKFFIGKKGVKKTLPVNTILTIPGSGSEMNSGMVLTNDDSKQKFGFGHRFLFPKTSILDPELTFTISPQYTAYGAIDAISHILEFYLTTEKDDLPVQQRFMEGLIHSIIGACNSCLAKPDNYNARADLMWATTLALNGLTASGLGKVGFPMHLLEHSLSGMYDTPHGAGLAALLPGWLHYFLSIKPQRLERLGKGVFPENIAHTASQDQAAADFISLFCTWMEKIEVPTSLERLGIPIDAFQDIAAHTQGLAKIWRLREYTPELLESILWQNKET